MNTVPRPLGARSEALEGEAAHPVWDVLRNHLESSKRSILQEIRNYPPPIAACDQQFNYLLEERERISEELGRLTSVHSNTAQGTYIEALNDFVSTSAYIHDELKARLRTELKRESSAAG